MSVNIIATEDAKALVNKLKTSFQTSADQTQTFSPNSFLKSKTTQTGNSVRVIFLTTLSWQELHRLKKADVMRLFSQAEKTVVLWSCKESVKSAATSMFAKIVDNWEAVGFYEASGEEWYNAEARIKYRLSKLENGEVKIPGASRYIIKPDAVSPLSESDAEVVIILFEADKLTDVDKLQIEVGDKVVEAKKIQSNVWSFCASDLGPGDHEIRVLADDTDLGTNTLHVQDRYVMMKHELGKMKQEEPEQFLADLLKLDAKEFDRDLEDYISDSSCIAVIEKLLKYGDDEEHEYPTFLHFCSKYGLESCINWCKKYHPNFKQACMVENKDNKTPEQLATETHQNQLLIQTLHNPEHEDLQPIMSPFKMSERFSFQNSRKVSSCPEMAMTEKSRDSGCISFHGSGDSLDPSTGSLKRPATDKRPYKFDRVPHPYNTIDDGEEDRSTGTYSRPWDNKTIFANRSAQAWSAGDLPESMNKKEEGTRSTGITRSNTTGNRNTKL